MLVWNKKSNTCTSGKINILSLLSKRHFQSVYLQQKWKHPIDLKRGP